MGFCCPVVSSAVDDVHDNEAPGDQLVKPATNTLPAHTHASGDAFRHLVTLLNEGVDHHEGQWRMDPGLLNFNEPICDPANLVLRH